MDEINQYLKILELEPGATLEEIKEAYRDLAFVWHPDIFIFTDIQYRSSQKNQKKNHEVLTHDR